MNPKRPDDLDVTESEYLDADNGPPEDTDVFHRRTPAPGERSHVAPAANRASSDSHRVPRISQIQLRPPEEPKLSIPEFPLWMIGVGVLAAVSILVLGSLVVWLSMPRQLEVPKQADTTTPTEEGKWQGLDVKKGLR